MINTLKEQKICYLGKKPKETKPHICQWKADAEHYTLNIDGSCLPNGNAGTRAIIRNMRGDFVNESAIFVGKTDHNPTEILALKKWTKTMQNGSNQVHLCTN